MEQVYLHVVAPRITAYDVARSLLHEFFRFSKKMPKTQNVHLKCWNDKSHCQVSVVGLKSLGVSPCNEFLLLPMIIKNSLAWEYFFTHKWTFVVHYRTGSPGQLGLWVAGFPGHWVAGSQNVTQFHLWHGWQILIDTDGRWQHYLLPLIRKAGWIGHRRVGTSR